MGRIDKGGELEAGVTVDRDGSGRLRTRRTRAPGQEMTPPGPAHIGDLRPDPRNARKHSPRNVGTIVDALHEVGAARSIVIDEDNVILAGNATVEAAAEAGITKVQVVETDGQTVVAVRRSGLTVAQKARLALYDNRAAELAGGWNTEVLQELQAQGLPLTGLWTDDELARLTGETITDVDGQWIDMPEFINDPKAFKTIMVHFDNQEDVDDFAARVQQTIGPKTRYLWHRHC